MSFNCLALNDSIAQTPSKIRANVGYNYGEKTKLMNNIRDEVGRDAAIVNQTKKHKKHWAYVVYGTQMGLALGCGVLTAILLYVFNPPITQKSRIDHITQEKQSWIKVLSVFCIIVFIVFILPDLMVLLHIFDRR